MPDQRYLVTGGAGLIGSTIAEQLTANPDVHVTVLDNLSRGRLENLAWADSRSNLSFVEGDIRDRKQVRAVMDAVDVVFHQAAIRITQCEEEPRLALDVMATGAFNVFEAAAYAGVRKVVAASSASVYGLAEEYPTIEAHHPYGNRTLYGATKTFNEGLLRAFNERSGLDYVALRYFNVYGPRMDVHGVYTEVLVRWMECIDAGEAPTIFGDGSQTMDFVFVDDVARANLLAAEAPATDVVLNVGSGVETSLTELATTLISVMGADAEPRYEAERSVNAVRRRLADTSSARRLIGFDAEVPLDEGLKLLLSWWRAERAAAAER
jgi:nucleoside-diphosphate-sugar epimerase